MPRIFLAVLLLLTPAFSSAQDVVKKPLASAEAKSAFRKQLDRPKVPAEPKVESRETVNGLVVERLTIATEKKPDGTLERVPTLMISPTPSEPVKPRPAVIVLHGTGGSKDGMKGWLEEFARKGVIGVAIDARYHGSRSGGATGSTAYVAAITKAWQAPADKPHEHPFYYDTVWDLWRLVDYLQTRPDVDKDRIGMLGVSMGGIQTWLAASVDDRIAAAAPLIAVQSFRWSLENEKWQGRAKTIQAAHAAAAKDLGESEVNAKVCRVLWNKVIPGILDDFDCPNLLPLFAGRPLYIANGELDPNCPIGGARISFEKVKAAYDKAGTPNKLVIRVADGVAHKVTDEQHKEAVEFLVNWLSAR